MGIDEKGVEMKNKSDRWFLLNGKKVLILFAMFFAAVILHNLIYGLFQSYFDSHGGDEPVFFIIAVFVIPIYFFICFVYTLIKMIKEKTIFEKRFIIRVILAIVFGVVVSWTIIQTTRVNEPAFVVLSVIFSMISYYLVKCLIRKFYK